MADANPTESPLEAAAGAAGPRATDAFELLSDETLRLTLDGDLDVVGVTRQSRETEAGTA